MLALRELKKKLTLTGTSSTFIVIPDSSELPSYQISIFFDTPAGNIASVVTSRWFENVVFTKDMSSLPPEPESLRKKISSPFGPVRLFHILNESLGAPALLLIVALNKMWMFAQMLVYQIQLFSHFHESHIFLSLVHHHQNHLVQNQLHSC